MVEFVLGNGLRILEAVTMVVGAFALIATITPTEADNKIADKLMKAIHFLGANFGKARIR
jgi:hypothetical protein